MSARWFIRGTVGLALSVACSGLGLAGERPPTPEPPPLEQSQPRPGYPRVETFAICGPGTKCECENVVSIIQASEGQSCTVTSSTGSCTFTSRESDAGVCCVCRP
jgi:hypothetical protein